MLKFLRKYNTVILVVGGVLLMIAFLLPQAIQQLGRRVGDKAVASLDGESIKMSDVATADRELSVLRTVSPRINTPSGAIPLIDLLVEDDRSGEHWMLLSEAATRAGFVGDAQHGIEYLDEIAQVQVVTAIQADLVQRQINPTLASTIAQQQFESDQGQEMFRQVRAQLLRARSETANRARMTPEDFDRALAKMRGVQRMLNAYQTSARMSSIEAQRVASNYVDAVIADVVQIRADDLVDENLTPTDEQLQAHFEQYKELRPGEEGLGFGYRLPDRVKVQWIMLDRQAISDAVEIDVLEIAKAHQADRVRYPGELTAERPRIEADLRNARVTKLMDLAETAIRSEISKLTRSLENDGDYRELPEGWQTPDLFRIAVLAADAVRQNESMPTFPTPRAVRRDASWLDARRLSELENIGRSAVVSSDVSGRVIPMAAVALSVRELEPQRSLGVQVGVPFLKSQLQDFLGNRYILTVTDAAEESVPGSIDELIDAQQLRDDWRRAQAYEFLLAQQATLETLAADQGLEAVVEALFPAPEPDAIVDPVTDLEAALAEQDDRPEVQRDVSFGASQVTALGRRAAYDTEEVRDAVRALGEPLDPAQSVADIEAPQRTTAVPCEPVRSLVVARVVGLSPLTSETFRQVRDAAVQRGYQDEVNEAELESRPFDFEPLASRLNYEVREGMEGRIRGSDDS